MWMEIKSTNQISKSLAIFPDRWKHTHLPSNFESNRLQWVPSDSPSMSHGIFHKAQHICVPIYPKSSLDYSRRAHQQLCAFIMPSFSLFYLTNYKDKSEKSKESLLLGSFFEYPLHFNIKRIKTNRLSILVVI